MTTIETFGKCKCGEYSPLSAIVCDSCGARLPWAVTPRHAKAGSGYPSPPNSAVASVTTRTQMAQSGYWNSALGGGIGGAYGSEPDIDFTPMSPMSRVDHYCPSCGMGLTRSQEMCPRCRHLGNFTRADLRLSLLVGGLMTTGFLLGVLWCSVIVTYLQTGKWPILPTAATTQTAPAQTAPAKPKLPKPVYSGTPGQ